MNEKMKTDRMQQFAIFKRVEKEAERFFAQRETGKALPVWERRPLRKIGEQGLGAEAAIDLFVKEYSEGLALNSGPRFFGYVIGGVTPAALAGDWLTSLYDQNAFGEMDCMDRQIEDEAIEGLASTDSKGPSSFPRLPMRRSIRACPSLVWDATASSNTASCPAEMPAIWRNWKNS